MQSVVKINSDKFRVFEKLKDLILGYRSYVSDVMSSSYEHIRDGVGSVF